MDDNFPNRITEVSRKLPKNLDEKDVNLFSHELKISIYPPTLLQFKKVIVFGGTICYRFFSTKPCYLPSSHHGDVTRRTVFTLGKDLVKVSLKRGVINLSRASLVADNWSANYFHWFTDIVPKLIYLENNYSGYPVLLPKKFHAIDFIKSSIASFNLNFVWLTSFQTAVVEDCIAVPNFAPTGNFIPASIISTRKKFGITEKKGSRKIFVKRSAPLNRRVLNEQEILFVLERYSFEIIDLDKIEWKDQLALFSTTKILIAVHGAALTNMLFMPEDSHILELRKDGDAHNNCYFSLSSAVGVNYYYQLCKIDDPNAETQVNNFYVCPFTLEKNIKLLLKSV